jgi:hypothetical protein
VAGDFTKQTSVVYIIFGRLQKASTSEPKDYSLELEQHESEELIIGKELDESLRLERFSHGMDRFKFIMMVESLLG